MGALGLGFRGLWGVISLLRVVVLLPFGFLRWDVKFCGGVLGCLGLGLRVRWEFVMMVYYTTELKSQQFTASLKLQR